MVFVAGFIVGCLSDVIVRRTPFLTHRHSLNWDCYIVGVFSVSDFPLFNM